MLILENAVRVRECGTSIAHIRLAAPPAEISHVVDETASRSLFKCCEVLRDITFTKLEAEDGYMLKEVS